MTIFTMDFRLRMIVTLLLLSLGCSHGRQLEFEAESVDEACCFELVDLAEDGLDQDTQSAGAIDSSLLMVLSASALSGAELHEAHDARSEWWTIAPGRAPPSLGSSVAPSETHPA